MRLIGFLLSIFLLNFTLAYAQKGDLGSWNILNVKYSLNSKWSFAGEAQIRSLKFYTHYHYYEYKGIVNYKFNKNAKLSLGSGSYQTYREGGNFVLPKNNNEFRIWPQITLNQSLGEIKVEQRYRSELRFTSNGYRNRFRYRLGLSYSFGKEIESYKPFQVSISNELFFTDNEPYFERNRLLMALNYKPSKSITLQLGYLNQFDYKINDESGRDFFVLGIYYEIFRPQITEKVNEVEIRDN